MKPDITKIIKDKKQWFKDREYKYGPHIKIWRYWRQAYIDQMLSDGYEREVAEFYNHLLTKRYEQSAQIAKKRQFFDYWMQYAIDKPERVPFIDMGNSQLIQIDKDKYIPATYNDNSRTYKLPNGYVFSKELIEYMDHPFDLLKEATPRIKHLYEKV